MPRKPKLTQERQARIIDALELGMKIKDVCAIGDISQDTYFSWIKRGENGDGKMYSEFSEAVKKAVPTAKAARINMILEAGRGGQEITEKRITSRKVGEGNVEVLEQVVTVRITPPQWQAIAWSLERQFPDDFGRRDRVENLNIDLSLLSDEQLERISNGENVQLVLATSREGRTGAPAAVE